MAAAREPEATSRDVTTDIRLGAKSFVIAAALTPAASGVTKRVGRASHPPRSRVNAIERRIAFVVEPLAPQRRAPVGFCDVSVDGAEQLGGVLAQQPWTASDHRTTPVDQQRRSHRPRRARRCIHETYEVATFDLGLRER